MQELASQITALQQFAAELDGRLAAVGVGGVEGAVEVYRRLRAVLDVVPASELDEMLRRIDVMVKALGEIARRLAAVRDLKAMLEPVDSG